MSALDTEQFPRGALIAAGALIGFSLVATAVARFERLHAPPASTAAAVPSRFVDLRFVDEANGSVSVRDSRSGAAVASLAPGTNGFVRSVMRGLAHERKRRGLDATEPFRIAQWDHGRLTLEDRATSRVIDLDAFGDTNKDAFVQMLPGRRAPS